MEALRKEILKQKIDAEIFVGGSFARGTLIKQIDYDIDIFIRFNWRLTNLSDILEKIVDKVSEDLSFNLERTHGSRDYFRLKNKGAIFEIIPVCKIKKPREARNVTDLSYFHVNYVKKRIKNRYLVGEIMLAKKFFHSQKVYGAESYINGFSGYGIECLIISYGSFEKMLRALVKAKERIVLDPEKLYKKKSDVFFELNESKLHSPIILVDPTWKERNVLAALSNETFAKFQFKVRAFLKKPSSKFFDYKDNEIEDLKRLKGEFVHLKFKTDKQEGDIAGTKMKKFSRFLEGELKRYFDVKKTEFLYSNKKKSDFYLVVNPKKEIIKFGPPVKMEKNVQEFKRKNKDVFEKSGNLYSRQKVDFNIREFLAKWKKSYDVKMKEMGIVEMKISD